MSPQPSNDPNEEVLRRLANIELQITSLDESTAFGMRANKAELLKAVDAVFGKRKQRAQVYVAANGHRSVNDIAAIVKAKAPNVSPHLKALTEEGLLLPSIDGQQTFYRKKKIDQTLGITKRLREQFGLTADGTPV